MLYDDGHGETCLDNHRGRFAEALPTIAPQQFELYYLPDDPARHGASPRPGRRSTQR